MTTNHIPANRLLREFSLITGSITGVLFGLVFPWLFDYALPAWPWIIALTLGTIGLLYPQCLKPLYRSWMAIGHVLGWINTLVILALVFYLLITPTGLIMRIFGKDPMARKFLRPQKSYRVLATKPDRKQVERPF